MSYSLWEPEWESVCECRYDEFRDRMEREDCPFHHDLTDYAPEAVRGHPARKQPTLRIKVKDPAA
jgi:hypothetical protein